jgi:hypothetical protein
MPHPGDAQRRVARSVDNGCKTQAALLERGEDSASAGPGDRVAHREVRGGPAPTFKSRLPALELRAVARGDLAPGCAEIV